MGVLSRSSSFGSFFAGSVDAAGVDGADSGPPRDLGHRARRGVGWFGFLPVLSLTLLLGACRGEDARRPSTTATAPAVEAVQARRGALPLVERLSGTLWADNQITLYPEISGRVTAVYVKNNDTVELGQPLLELSDQQYREQVRQAAAGQRIAEARVRQAAARLAERESQASRTRSLGRGEFVTAVELETIAAQVEAARADLQLAEAQLEQASATLAEQEDLLGRTIVRAPFAGVVGQRQAEIGMQVSTSTRLFTIGNLNRMQVRVNLTDSMLRYIQAGHPVDILVPSNEGPVRHIRAQLTRISPFLNLVSRSTEAEIEIDNADGSLRPGMFVPVDILYGQSREATLIPTSAVFNDPRTGAEGVYVIGPPADGGSDDAAAAPPFGALSEPRAADFRPVQIIARGEMTVAVSSVRAGEWVVTIGQDLLAAGRQSARVRAVTWDDVMALQGLSREGLLRTLLQRPPEEERSDS
jgi:HlyD family secretion protein